MQVIKQFNQNEPNVFEANRTQVNINIVPSTRVTVDGEVQGFEYDTVVFDNKPFYSDEAMIEIATKEARNYNLERLTVTTQSGNVFDANNQARLDMQNAITASDFIGVTQTTWRMADDSEVLIDLSELKEALALAIQEYARLKGIGA